MRDLWSSIFFVIRFLVFSTLTCIHTHSKKPGTGFVGKTVGKCVRVEKIFVLLIRNLSAKADCVGWLGWNPLPRRKYACRNQRREGGRGGPPRQDPVTLSSVGWRPLSIHSAILRSSSNEINASHSPRLSSDRVNHGKGGRKRENWHKTEERARE